MTLLDAPRELSPARKAWATRRLQAAARSDIAAIKQGITEPSPVGQSAMVSLWIDDNSAGCGYRRFVVLSIGSKFVELFHAGTLARVKVDRLTFDRKAAAVPFHKRIVVDIIRRNMEERQQLFPKDCARRVAWAKQALTVLNASRGGKRRDGAC